MQGVSPQLLKMALRFAQGAGRAGSSRETMTTGLTLAASPKSASQTSSSFGFIDPIQDFLLDVARSGHIEEIAIGKFNHLGDPLAGLLDDSGLPSLQATIQNLCQDIHGLRGVPVFSG